MMKVFTPRTHGYLDYLTVIILLAGPGVFGLSGLPAALSYILAVVHLVLTLVTASPLGVLKKVPLPLHGRIELIVALGLVILPSLLESAFNPLAGVFYTAIGGVIFLVWLFSRYQEPAEVPLPDQPNLSLE
ncbi:MAG TPA: hypothetical protein VK963_01705 [Candidatus Saccharimonadales bacterium]|nr:hypothetical protein [Candidatus Saccharimonadales bacterium]